MRDEFSRDVKEILAKRVGLYCSNPSCRTATIGPNTHAKKTTSIGVAAHISAASGLGPRYDNSLSPQERSSISNAIWLCQSCAKLIDSDTTKYSKDLLLNWKKEAEKEAEKRLDKREAPFIEQDYQDVFILMPTLIKELSDDVKANPLLRELILQGRGWIYNATKQVLVYYYDDHESLDNKIRLLENNGLIEDIKFNNVKRYLLTEKFANILRNYDGN